MTAVLIKLGGTNDALAQVFMNIVLDEAFEEKDGGEKVSAGMVVRSSLFTDAKNPANACRYQVIRGNSIVMLEALERITDK